MPIWNFQSKNHVESMQRLLTNTKLSKTSALDALKHFYIFDAYLYNNPTKCNIVRYLLWLSFVTKTNVSDIYWIREFIRFANIKQWDDSSPFTKGMKTVDLILDSEHSSNDESYDSNGESDVGSAPSNTDTEADTDREVSLSSQEDDEEEHEEELENDVEEENDDDAMPNLTQEQVTMILGDDIELTERGKLSMDKYCDLVMQQLTRDKFLIESAYKEHTSNTILKQLLKPSKRLNYNVFILQSLRYIILKEAFEYCIQHSLNQVRKSVIDKVCTRNEVGKTLKLLSKY